VQNHFDMGGRVVLVTGASSGIGAATAKLFSELGASVAITFFNKQEGAKQVLGELRTAGTKHAAFRADLRNREQIHTAVQAAADQLGPIDVLVNNAGSLVARRKLSEIDDRTWNDVMDLNLRSAVLSSQLVATSMIERRSGAIINVGSIAGHSGGGPGAGIYAAAKGASISFTKSLAKELAPDNIRVNAISPGVIDTPFHATFSTPEMMRNFQAAIPLGRIGQPAECASVIAFLASPASSFVVGETIEANGGQLIR